jgi:nucleotide-binding universal stress UspA family protein
MKILLAVDGSTFTTKAVTYLATHLQWFQDAPELHLLHVKPPIPVGLAVTQARAILGNDAVEDYYKEEAAAALGPAEKVLHKLEIPFQSTYKVGDIAHEIKHYAAEHEIDMIVMGSHGHGALAGVVLGSVATKVLATTASPVLIVR